jgi:hypothetical protein
MPCRRWHLQLRAWLWGRESREERVENREERIVTSLERSAAQRPVSGPNGSCAAPAAGGRGAPRKRIATQSDSNHDNSSFGRSPCAPLYLVWALCCAAPRFGAERLLCRSCGSGRGAPRKRVATQSDSNQDNSSFGRSPCAPLYLVWALCAERLLCRSAAVGAERRVPVPRRGAERQAGGSNAERMEPGYLTTSFGRSALNGSCAAPAAVGVRSAGGGFPSRDGARSAKLEVPTLKQSASGAERMEPGGRLFSASSATSAVMGARRRSDGNEY